MKSSIIGAYKYANHGFYSDGALKFFIITRNAILDHPHAHPSNNEATQLYYTDEAGDFKSTANTIYTGTTSGQFDFKLDIDYFVFQPSSTKNYSLVSSNSSGDDINAVIYDKNGSIIVDASNIGQVNTLFYAISGNRYFIKLYNQSENPGTYTITIS